MGCSIRSGIRPFNFRDPARPGEVAVGIGYYISVGFDAIPSARAVLALTYSEVRDDLPLPAKNDFARSVPRAALHHFRKRLNALHLGCRAA
jgi:hypothetical protein